MDNYRMVESRDVTDFLSGFLSFIKGLVGYSIGSLKQCYKTAIVIFIISAGVGFSFWYYSKSLFESEMVCEFNTMNKKTYGEMVQKLNLLAKSHSYGGLAYNLHIPLKVAKEIVGIEGKNMEGSNLYEDITVDKTPMYFKLIATSNDVYNTVQNALLEYMNSNSPYRLQRNKMETDRVNEKLDFLKGDISMVDTIIESYCAYLRNANLHSDTSNRISGISALLNYKNGLEEALLAQEWTSKELKSSVELLYGFTPADKSTYGKSKILIATVFISIFLAFFGAILSRILGDITKQ